MGRDYKLEESKEVFQLFKAIYFSKGELFWTELLKVSGKSKANLSAQLRPLREAGLVEKIYIKEKKDYLFKINFDVLEEFLVGKAGINKHKKDGSFLSLHKALMIELKENYIYNKDLFVAQNFEQYKFLKSVIGKVPINKKSDLKQIFR